MVTVRFAGVKEFSSKMTLSLFMGGISISAIPPLVLDQFAMLLHSLFVAAPIQ
jgi:hypothetical protein